jgi:hypothetical protein
VLATLYVVLQRMLQLVNLLSRSAEFKELELVVLRHDGGGAATPGPSTDATAGRPDLSDGDKPGASTRQLVVISRHASHASELASAVDGEPLDVRATLGSSADRP